MQRLGSGNRDEGGRQDSSALIIARRLGGFGVPPLPFPFADALPVTRSNGVNRPMGREKRSHIIGGLSGQPSGKMSGEPL